MNNKVQRGREVADLYGLGVGTIRFWSNGLLMERATYDHHFEKITPLRQGKCNSEGLVKNTFY